MFFYMEQTCEEMRHLENLRERVSILVITLSSAIAGFIVQQKFAPETKFLIWFILFLGFFGLLMSLKIFQIHQMGQKRLNKWYTYLESHCGQDPQILKLKRLADTENRTDFNYVVKIPHNYFWSAIYVFIILAGFALFFIHPSKETEPIYHVNTVNVLLKEDFKIDTIQTIKDTVNISKK
jgi:hypothetical protein